MIAFVRLVPSLRVAVRFVATVASLVLVTGAMLAAQPQPDAGSRAAVDNVLFVDALTGTGTAFLLRHGGELHLVTADHVVRDCLAVGREPRFELASGAAVRAQLVRANESLDVAVYRVLSPVRGGGLLPAEHPDIGDEVRLVGFPAPFAGRLGTAGLRAVRGCVANPGALVTGAVVEHVDLDLPGCDHGHSGGPVLDAAGRVIGVAVQRRSSTASEDVHATLAVPIAAVLEFVDGRMPQVGSAALAATIAGTAPLVGVVDCSPTDRDLVVQRICGRSGRPVYGPVFVSQATTIESHAVPVEVGNGDLLVFFEVEYGAAARFDVDIDVRCVHANGQLAAETADGTALLASSQHIERAPSAAADGRGGAIVAFEVAESEASAAVFAIAVDGLGRRVAVAEVARAAARPLVVAGEPGTVLVVYRRELPRGGHGLAARTLEVRAGSLVVGSEREVAPAVRVTPQPVVAGDGAGGAFVVFACDSAHGGSVAVRRLASGGAPVWRRAAQVLADGSAARSLAAVADGAGGVLVAIEVCTGSAPAPEDHLTIQHVGGAGDVLFDRDGRTIHAARQPSLAADGAGGVVVAFEAGSPARPRAAVQRFSADGRRVWALSSLSEGLAPWIVAEHPTLLGVVRDRVVVAFEDATMGRASTVTRIVDLGTGQAGGAQECGVVLPNAIVPMRLDRPDAGAQ